MKKLLPKLLCCVLALTPIFAKSESSHETGFISSFLKHFEFSPEGRYVHEYHPFLLEQTAESFRTLEDELTKEQFTLNGRFAILGYEENSVPPYYTNFRTAKINDEATTKNNAGWSLKLHNRFGFMTGFILKDVNLHKNNQDSIFEHINTDLIPLFSSQAEIFHQHAFGETLPFIATAYNKVNQALYKNDYRRILSALITFWDTLYKGYLKVGNKQVAGTQDILFSIKGVEHLLASKVPLKKYFTGPDITYPIEIFNKQHKEATRHAQTFVRRFVENLVPQQNETTVYIFSSFVDGVGKSTMLGNIKNYIKHGDQIDQFEHVDNSSSQLAEVFPFKDNVFIADLPAQMSHFTYKPDGYVFVDIKTEKKYVSQLPEIQAFVKQAAQQLEKTYLVDLTNVRKTIAQEGFFAPSLQDLKQADRAFLRNLILLKKDHENYWVPFTFNNNFFLFNADNPTEIRSLQPLADVKSEGLKNIQSEQMLFLEGIRFPLTYKSFIKDLIQKFKDNGIKQAVFVDFLSMYPRSSRENIRINYVLQQLGLLDPAFDVHDSVYHDFVSGGELLYTLETPNKASRLQEALKLETLTRLFLHKQIVERQEGDLTGISVIELTQRLSEQIKNSSAELNTLVHRQVHDKVKKELSNLEKVYGRSKSYVNIQQLSLANVSKFSDLIQDLLHNTVINERLNMLWDDIGNIINNDTKNIALTATPNNTLTTDKDIQIFNAFSVTQECKDELQLRPLLRMVRASWYASLANLLFAYPGNENHFILTKEQFLVPPCMVKIDNNNIVHVIQPFLEPWEQPQVPPIQDLVTLFNLPSQHYFGSFMNGIYPLDWNSYDTGAGIFGFDYMHEATVKKMLYGVPRIVTKTVNQHQAENDSHTVLPAHELYTLLEQNIAWPYQQESLHLQAQRNGKVSFTEGVFSFEKTQATDPNKPAVAPKKTIKKKLLGHPLQRDGARHLIRLLATLEMIIKDPETNIIIRKNNREDFTAAIKLLEKITLPYYFHIIFDAPLFNDYESIEPYPSWDYWE